MGDFEDLATPADIIEFTKRKSAFGPEKLVLREDLIPINPTSPPSSPTTGTPKPPTNDGSNLKPLPRGTLHIGDSLPAEAVPSLPWLVNQASEKTTATRMASDDIPVMETAGDNDHAFRRLHLSFYLVTLLILSSLLPR
jgi:hypothetical protein